MESLVIIGNGITGITTARLVRKQSDRPIIVISDETDFFYSRPALMYIYMGHMKFEHTKPYEDWFWEKNKIQLLRATVMSIDTDAKSIVLNNGQKLPYGQLVIATGSRTNKFGWPGQDLPGVQGLYGMRDIELMEKNTSNISKAVIVGGGLIGIEMAEMLHSRNIPVTFLVRETNYWDNILPQEEAKLVGRHIGEYGIDLRLGTQLKEILAGNDGRVRAIVTDKGEEIGCQFVGLTAGVAPNTDVAKNSKIEINRGVLVNEFLETNIADVYAAGDCAEFKMNRPRHPKIEQLWYTGRMQAEVLAKTLCGNRTAYDRGVWFNSAKFFDIEYQTYGFVSNVPVQDEESLYWEHPDGKHSIRIVYHKTGQTVIGFNLFGIRYRQAICERWIKEQRTIEYVLENLGAANFDPEFFSEFEKEAIDLFNSKHPERKVFLKRRRGLFQNA
ncbi:FAD-dependent oxidoreductase [bacterium]|nr:FAD-dependent oxidoreductase [bacterium]